MLGQLAIVLHAHLPFVRHPEHECFYEESWLFEAVAECYLPLLRVMDGWTRDDVAWRLTLTLTPTLCAMLCDPLLQQRCARYLDERVELAAKEVERALLATRLHAVTQFYQGRFVELRQQWDSLGGDVVGAFARHQDAGHLEILTCAATHALLPLWLHEPAAIRAQLAVAVADYWRHFGRAPRGIWLPECGWTPDLEPYLSEAGLGWFVLETHGVLNASPRPRCATFAPVLTPGGLATFGRDPASAQQVWSRHGGYPGDPRYREFHQDLAHEAEWDYVKPHLPGGDQRVFTGLKYHRVTGSGSVKEIYERGPALAAAGEHARHFVAERARVLAAAAELMPGRQPLVVAPFDAELFGHWWFEGPEFLDAVVRCCAGSESGFAVATLGGFLRENPEQQVALPAASTWGEGGHLAVWLDESNAWMQPTIRQATRRMIELASVHAAEAPAPLVERGLRQAGREVLLAQASDWPFLVKMGTAGEYPASRFRAHVSNFHRLADALASGDRAQLEPVLADLEARNNLFPNLDWRCWLP
jgi:1,4-alpha-glucan branching enzyme